MIHFLTSTSTVRLIEQIVVDAEDNLVLVSSSPRFSKKLAGQLQEAHQRGVSIDLIVDDVLFDEGMLQSLSDLDQFRILRCLDLNAQCYMNESTMVITTMAITDLPPTGIYFGLSATSDESAFDDAKEYIDSLKESGTTKVTHVRREYCRSKVKKPRGLRSPLMRVVRGSLAKKWAKSVRKNSYDFVCDVCKEPFRANEKSGSGTGKVDQSDNYPIKICADCERRKRYQHTSLYLAAESA
ncbi:MAG: hypothetical protein E2O84_02980 [Bacteroidetes bacterium]|nr:MAG: hypothetical protein E2O84_02980 [Bacteroidota bacterium]